MGIEVYNQQNAISDDPYVLVLKLYEGVIKYLSFVKSAMQEANVESKFNWTLWIKSFIWLCFKVNLF